MVIGAVDEGTAIRQAGEHAGPRRRAEGGRANRFANEGDDEPQLIALDIGS